MNKYEKLIEYIIAEQDDLARQLFHEIVVEKSRRIYESLSEDDMDMMDGMDRTSGVDGLMNEIEADEIQTEADEEPDMDMDMGDDEADMDMDMDMDDDEADIDMDMGDDEADMDMDMGDDEDGEIGELEDRVVDLESALDELKAEFDALMADQDGDGDHDMDDHEAEEDEGEEDEGEEMVREYVEKVSAPANTEGHEVGAGKSAAINKASPGLQKANNMGGKRFDLGRGAENAPDGQRPHSNAKAPQEIDVAKRNVNKVGGNKGAQDFYGTKAKAKAKAGEEGGVNKNSIESGSK
jgi:hypothetical protein